MPAKRAQHTTHHPIDVAVLGGGVAGLAVAWRARARGLTVRVLDRGELGAGTSRVAQGMLAPVTEADAGERPLPLSASDSARRWPGFAAELEEATGVEIGYRRSGTPVVARDRDEAEADRELALRSRLAGGRAPAAVRRPPGGARAGPDGPPGPRRPR